MAPQGTKALFNPKERKSTSAGGFGRSLWPKTIDSYPFQDISPHLQLRYNAQAKRLALRLDIKKRIVFLVVPKRGSIRSAYKFALEHKNWIRDRIAELPEKIALTDGNIIPLFGKNYVINVCYDSTLRKTGIYLKDKEIIVSTNKENPESRIRRFIIDYAREELTVMAREKAAQIGKKVKSVTVKDTASRWGSCSTDAEISFSWRLAFAPVEACDYVVAHEVAHLVHMDHSSAFWKQCSALSQNYVRGKAWMKINAQELLRYN